MAASNSSDIPPTHRALVLNSTRDPYDMSVVQQASPQAGPGSAVIRVLSSAVLTYADRVYSGKKPYLYPMPFVPGSSAIARIAAVGPDATALTPGQLVFFDCYIHGRDDTTSLFLHGLSSGFSPGSHKLMELEWRDGTYAEYAKVPLENCFPLDEARLMGSPADGGLGYTAVDLTYLLSISVPFGGLRDLEIKAGDTIIITPATGSFGSAAVLAALAMGARVIAMGRNLEALSKLKASSPNGRLRLVQNTGDVAADLAELTKEGPVDGFLDISPGAAAGSTHFESCIKALRRGGRVSLMGAHHKLELPTQTIMLYDIVIKGRWMYTKDDMRAMVRLLETGYMRLDCVETVGKFGLEDFAAAFESGSKKSGVFLQTVIVP